MAAQSKPCRGGGYIGGGLPRRRRCSGASPPRPPRRAAGPPGRPGRGTSPALGSPAGPPAGAGRGPGPLFPPSEPGCGGGGRAEWVGMARGGGGTPSPARQAGVERCPRGSRTSFYSGMCGKRHLRRQAVGGGRSKLCRGSVWVAVGQLVWEWGAHLQERKKWTKRWGRELGWGSGKVGSGQSQLRFDFRLHRSRSVPSQGERGMVGNLDTLK